MRFVHPLTGAALRGAPEGSGVLRGAGDVVFPVLGGVPVLLPDAARWCATHHDAIVATLAAAGRLDDDALAIVASFAAAGRDDDVNVSPAPFVDDFTPEEAADAPPPRLLHRAVGPLVEDAVFDGPLAWIARQLGRPRVALELGPGAGALTTLLGDVVQRAGVVVDISLRAVLLAVARGGPRVRGVVADAGALPFAAATFDLVVGNNVVDVVDAPGALIAHAVRVLRPGGRLVLTTPDPALGGRAGRDDRALEHTLRQHGLVLEDAEDGILWPRVHGPRHVELWVCRAVVARRPLATTAPQAARKAVRKAVRKA